MKIQFAKNYLSYKKDQVEEIADAEVAAELVAKGVAVEVKEDPMANAIVALEAKINDAASKAATKAAEETVARVSKGLKGLQPKIVVGPDNVENDPANGFKSPVEFLQAVIKYSRKDGTDDRLKPLLKTAQFGNSEGAAPDAGPTVPVAYTGEIFQVTGRIPSFWDYLFKVPVNTSSVKIPVLKNYNRANVTATAGVVAAVTAEATNITASESNWEQLSISLAKETVLIPVSNELLEDNIVSLPSVLSQHSQYQLTKAINRGILQGSTCFTALIGNAAVVNCTTTTTASSGTIASFKDVLNMYAAFAHDDADYNNAVWFVHPTVLPALGNMTSGNFNIYLPPGGAQDGGIGKLLGRPLIVTGQCNAANTSGDIVLADMSKYVGIFKGGVQSMVSPHIYFVSDQQAFRFTQRIGGKPGLSGTITLEDGSTVVSPFVTLATRTG